ncbi:MAG: T9SS type A sorting domain-containing protein [Chitinophagales bacterium]
MAVIDLNGRLLEKLEVGSTNQQQLSTIGMPAGTYLIQAISQAGIKTTIKRLVVIR